MWADYFDDGSDEGSAVVRGVDCDRGRYDLHKGHLKNKGANALDITGVATKFAGRGELEKAYNFAMGLSPAGVICEILNEDGSLARLPDLLRFKEEHGLKLISIADLIEYRHTRDRLVERRAGNLPERRPPSLAGDAGRQSTAASPETTLPLLNLRWRRRQPLLC